MWAYLQDDKTTTYKQRRRKEMELFSKEGGESENFGRLYKTHKVPASCTIQRFFRIF